jgi:Cdc6-like AAA superfamily ATPase
MVVENLQAQHDLGLAYFYVNAAERLSFGKVISTLLRQLLEQVSDIPVPTRQFYESRKPLPPDDNALASAFYEVLNLLPGVVVVIDGIDELEFRDTHDILHFLSQAQRSNLKLIIFSRPHLDLDQLVPHEFTVEIDHQNEDDIRRFVQLRLSKSQHLIKHPEMLQRLENTIAPKASGMWVVNLSN